MLTKDQLDQVRKLIRTDKSQEAFTKLKGLMPETAGRLNNELLLLESDFQHIGHEIRKGILTHEYWRARVNQINARLLELISRMGNPSIDESTNSGFHFDPLLRTRLIVLAARQLVNEDMGPGYTIRQKGEFSSFSIPKMEVNNPIWKIRAGAQPRSSEYHELQREERIYLQELATKASCKLIIYPYQPLNHRGTAATITRLRTLQEFLLTHSDSIQVVISSSAKNVNSLMIGERFLVDSISSEEGFTQNYYSWDRAIVEHSICKFDMEFKLLFEEQGATSSKVLDNVVNEIGFIIKDLESQSSGQLYLHSLETELGIIPLEQDPYRYLKYDSTFLCLNVSEMQELRRVLVEYATTKSKSVRLQMLQGIRMFLTPKYSMLSRMETPAISAYITQNQYEDLLNYITRGEYYLDSFEQHLKAVDQVFAFSFGTTDEVNSALAEVIYSKLSVIDRSMKWIIQWEIFDHLVKKDLDIGNNGTDVESGDLAIKLYRFHDHQVFRIGKQSREQYLSTADIINFGSTLLGDGDQVGIVGQSWHAVRCRKMLEALPHKIVFGSFVDEFCGEDPEQPWVRDFLSWLIKES
ncbi:MAG: hypothetical protein HRU41_40960 [Saprospiraceae bacterium]|nr:hypothetical protein [Saprospiraceae bacterium]